MTVTRRPMCLSRRFPLEDFHSTKAKSCISKTPTNMDRTRVTCSGDLLASSRRRLMAIMITVRHSQSRTPSWTWLIVISDVHLLTPSRIGYESSPSRYASEPLPSEKDWQQLWTAWDTVTRAMVPRDEL